jgi:tRNA(Ile)-lysidine synthase
LIVDHGLRPESEAEARRVAGWARAASWKAHVLKWTGRKPRANIEDEARRARYRLLGEWCREHRAPVLFVAHTRDDVAETFLMRLGRGSGVDGLAAMRARAPFPLPGFGEMTLVRPLLEFGRDELRHDLKAIGAQWLEDPMNEDPRFARARVRKLLPLLDEAGISPGRIAEAGRHLLRAREALDMQTVALLSAATREAGAGRVLADSSALAAAPREIGLRALSHILGKIGGEAYRPRFESLEALYDAICSAAVFRARTLHGCRVGKAPKRAQFFGPQTLEIAPEPARKSPRAAKSP